MARTGAALPLEDLLPRTRAEFQVQGNDPVVLDRSDRVWIVTAGRVDVFAVRIQDGVPMGARRFLFHVDAGDAMFGLGEGRGTGLFLLGAGLPGTRAMIVHRPHLEQAQHSAELVRVIERWVGALGLAARRELTVPDLARPIPRGGDVLTIEKGKHAVAREGTSWIRVLSGEAYFLGLRDLGAIDGLVPLTPGTWIEAASEVEIAAVDTATWLAADPGWSALDAFHQLVLRAAARVEALETEEEELLVQDRIASDGRLFTSALSSLHGIVGPGAAAPLEAALDAAEDPLLAACRAVGARVGIDVRGEPPSRRRKPSGDRIAAIARASRCRIRKVVLTGKWWEHESGPLLGMIGEEKRPVALIPSGREYFVEDPAGGKRARVDADVAAALAQVGWAFYRPFPDAPIGPLQVLAFALRGSRRELVRMLALGAGIGVLGTMPALATGLLFDTVIPGAERGQLFQMVVLLGAIAFASSILGIARGLSTLRVEERMSTQVQSAVWDRLLKLPATFFHDFSAGDLAIRANAIDEIRRILSGTTLASLLGGFFSLFNFGLMVFYDPTLAFAGFLLALVAAGVAVLSGFARVRHARARAKLEGTSASLLLQLLTGISKLRSAGAEPRAFAAWARTFGKKQEAALAARRVESRVAVFNTAYPVIAAGLIFATVIISSGRGLTTGTFLGFNAAFLGFLGGLLQLVQAGIGALDVVPLYELAQPILATAPEIDEMKGAPGELSGEIEVAQVSFRYGDSGPLVLDGVSLKIAPGEMVAIVGPSGSGKSTLLRMLLGFEKPTEGGIFYDGRDLAGLDPTELRRQLGVVLQSGQILEGSIQDNISGATEMPLEEVWEAARLASLADDIKKMPMGMQTYLSQGGATLSGGQKQRLLIARAIARRPRLLFFDEATSALDNRTQAAVTESLDALDATRIVIAHRLSTIRNADRIYVLAKGRLVESGTFDSLMAQDGVFADLARRQIA